MGVGEEISMVLLTNEINIQRFVQKKLMRG